MALAQNEVGYRAPFQSHRVMFETARNTNTPSASISLSTDRHRSQALDAWEASDHWFGSQWWKRAGRIKATLDPPYDSMKQGSCAAASSAITVLQFLTSVSVLDVVERDDWTSQSDLRNQIIARRRKGFVVFD
jgi:hypothetical protein